MSNLFEKYETDSNKETLGVRITFEDNVFICRRAGGSNRLHAFAQAAAAVELKAQYESEDEAVASWANNEIALRAFADAVIIGWENVLGRDNKPLEFTKENFLDLMRSCPEVWNHVRFEARDIDNFRKEAATEVAEEVGKSSSGENSGGTT